MNSNTLSGKTIPELDIHSLNTENEHRYSAMILNSQIKSFSPCTEFWTTNASNKDLSYYSHGIFRYFGKFPPPIARHLIKTYTSQNEMVIDPMCGCGTTALEALLLGRKAKCYDISPLATLISKVKVSKVNDKLASEYLEEVITNVQSKGKCVDYIPVGLKNYNHWFLPETITSLSRIKNAIEVANPPEDIRNVLFLSFLAIIRRVSRATTQQGRLFLDADTAEKDAIPFFYDKATKVIEAVSCLPVTSESIEIEKKSILDSKQDNNLKVKLIICHPPYFNAYKYSSVNSLELSWMGVDHSIVRKDEVREYFKVGKPEKITGYVEDIEKALRNIAGLLSTDGTLALMIGDTVLRGNYVPVTMQIVQRLSDCYVVERAALRIPKFTEASWAASQRRNGSQVGINLLDMVVILRKK